MWEIPKGYNCCVPIKCCFLFFVHSLENDSTRCEDWLCSKSIRNTTEVSGQNANEAVSAYGRFVRAWPGKVRGICVIFRMIYMRVLASVCLLLYARYWGCVFVCVMSSPILTYFKKIWNTKNKKKIVLTANSHCRNSRQRSDWMRKNARKIRSCVSKKYLPV